MKSNLDVYSIQHYPKELYKALDNIKKGISIIYSNTLSRLLVGNHKIYNTNYSIVVSNEKSDILILISNKDITKDDIIDYLEKKKKKYVEVTFSPITYTDHDDLPEIWYARDINVLEEAIRDSINRGNFNAIFYPYVYVQLNLGFKNKKNDTVEIDGRLCKGVIKFNDKTIILINQKDNIDEFERNKNVTIDQALYMFKKYNIKTDISYETYINLTDEKSEVMSLKKTYK